MLRLLLPVDPVLAFFDRVGPSLRHSTTSGRERGRVAADTGHLPSGSRRCAAPSGDPRLWWDPQGNESRYLMSCCERLLETGSARRTRDPHRDCWEWIGIVGRLAGLAGTRLVFRVRRLERDGEELVESIAFQSKALRPGWA